MPSIGIEKQTYVDADEKTTKALTYDLFVSLHKEVGDLSKRVDKEIDGCSERVSKIEKRKKFDTSISAVSGAIGGFIAILLKKLIG
jgi:hypothetical protein